MAEKTPKNRAEELLPQLSLEEKLYQLSCQMIFSVGEDYEQERNPMQGNYRNPGHFMHAGKDIPATPDLCLMQSASVWHRVHRGSWP